jgi:hypothetical protein
MTRRLISVGLVRILLGAALLAGPAARAADPDAAGADPRDPAASATGAPVDATPPADPPAAPPPAWVFGRTPAVFQHADESVATRVGGWIDASYRDSDVRGSSLSFDHVNAYLDTRHRAFQLFVEAEYENETKHTGYEEEREFELEQAYLRYARSDLLSLRVGRFNTPFGYWIPIHWSILMDTIEEPLFVGREWLPEQQLGAEAAGRWFPGELAGLHAELDWSLYAGGGSDDLDQDGVRGPAFGGDLRLRLDERWLLGTSLYRQRNRELDDRTEHTAGLYGEARLHERLVLRTEYLHQHREETGAAWWEEDADAVYGNVRWDFLRRAYLNYRYSRGDDDDEDALDTSRVSIHTVTLGVQPHASVRVKLEWSGHDFADRDREDFDFWGLSVGYLF